MTILKELKTKDYITLSGTVFGLIALLILIGGGGDSFSSWLAIWFLMLSLVTDVMDGYVARRLNQMNELGKELDSLSDCFTFGVCPALLVYIQYTRTPTFAGLDGIYPLLLLPSCVIFLLGALIRLAWFNIDKTEGYNGLVTPVSAGFIVALHLLDLSFIQIPGVGSAVSQVLMWVIPVVMILMAYFNICPYIVYGKNIRKKTGAMKYIFIIMGGLVFIAMGLGFLFPFGTAPIVVAILLFLLGVLTYYIYFGFQGYKINKSNPQEAENNKN
jgi:CDP-diacylglycerol--serine O-phosphatidyltransferase